MCTSLCSACAACYSLSMPTLPSTEYIDLSDVASLSDADLINTLETATARFAEVRRNDPRRVSLAYSDAKHAVAVLDGERRTRRAAALVEQQQLISDCRPLAPVPAPRDEVAVRARQSARGAFAGMQLHEDVAF